MSGGFWQNRPFLPLPWSRTEKGGGGSSGAAGRRRFPASRATVAARRWGRMKRVTREIDSHPHLELGRREEVDRRAAADWCWRCKGRRRCGGCGGSIARFGAAREVVLALYRRRRSVPGRNISPATSTPAQVWVATVGLDWCCDGSSEVTYRPVGGSTRAGEGLRRGGEDPTGRGVGEPVDACGRGGGGCWRTRRLGQAH
jgi:hypothetical protein